MRRLWMAVLLVAGCGAEPAKIDQGTRDMTVPSWDFTVGDLAVPPEEDLAEPEADLAVGPDLASPPGDLAVGPDLTAATGDMAKADLKAPPADLAKPDLKETPPDLKVEPPDLKPLPPDMTAPATGKCTPTVDGTIGAGEWDGAWVEENKVATDWGASNALRAIRVCYDDTNLYLAVDGQTDTTGTNAIVVYFDRDDGAATGVSDPGKLTDVTGMGGATGIDKAISARNKAGTGSTFVSWPSGFAADLAWATIKMQRNGPATVNNEVGVRYVAKDPANFPWIDVDKTECKATSCEVALDWKKFYDQMPRPAKAKVALFARLISGDGTALSNQTLPQDDATKPATVAKALKLSFP